MASAVFFPLADAVGAEILRRTPAAAPFEVPMRRVNGARGRATLPTLFPGARLHRRKADWLRRKDRAAGGHEGVRTRHDSGQAHL